MKKFRHFLLEHDINNMQLAEIIGISRQSVSHKLNERNAFSIEELNIIRLHFKLTDREFIAMFFEK